jgi:hypothetical protein
VCRMSSTLVTLRADDDYRDGVIGQQWQRERHSTATVSAKC